MILKGRKSVQEISFAQKERIFPQKRRWHGFQESIAKCANGNRYYEETYASEFNLIT